jgi:hypothetical protein
MLCPVCAEFGQRGRAENEGWRRQGGEVAIEGSNRLLSSSVTRTWSIHVAIHAFRKEPQEPLLCGGTAGELSIGSDAKWTARNPQNFFLVSLETKSLRMVVNVCRGRMGPANGDYPILAGGWLKTDDLLRGLVAEDWAPDPLNHPLPTYGFIKVGGESLGCAAPAPASSCSCPLKVR